MTLRTSKRMMVCLTTFWLRKITWQTWNKMKEKVCICFATAYVQIQPLYILVQQTKIHPQRKYKASPHMNPRNSGKVRVPTDIDYLIKERPKVTAMKTNNPSPYSEIRIMSLKYPLKQPPMAAPAPCTISKMPTSTSFLSYQGRKRLRSVVTKPSMNPSRIIGMSMYLILGQNLKKERIWLRRVLRSTRGCYSFWGGSSGSRRKQQCRNATIPRPVRMMKQTRSEKKSRVKVVIAAPTSTVRNTKPLRMPMYFPSSSCLMLLALKSCTMQPP